jgi:hypothetical protein
VRSAAYHVAQELYQQCVQMGDPNLLVQLLQEHPYPRARSLETVGTAAAARLTIRSIPRRHTAAAIGHL